MGLAQAKNDLERERIFTEVLRGMIESGDADVASIELEAHGLYLEAKARVFDLDELLDSLSELGRTDLMYILKTGLENGMQDVQQKLGSRK